MQLARHSDPRLTMATYGRSQIHDLGAAVDVLPALLTNSVETERALQATGTDGRPAPVCTGFAYPIATECKNVTEHDRTKAVKPQAQSGRNLLRMKEDAPPCADMMADEKTAPCRTRTYNPLIKSQLLCQLS